MNTVLLSLAQGAPAPQAPPGACGAGGMQSLILMAAMFAVFYFILIRPQQKRAREHQQMLANLSKGDQVVTRGGLVGRISGIQDNLVVLEVQEKVRIRVLRSHIDGRYQESGAAQKSGAPAKAEPAPTETK